MKKLIILIIGLFLFQPNSEAQLLKKIKDKVSKATEKQQDDETESDEEEDSSASIPFGLDGMNNVPDNYDFDWKYVLEMTDSKNESQDIIYRLSSTQAYFGFEMQDDSNLSTSVYDHGAGKIVMFMNNDGQKSAMAINMPKKLMDDMIEENMEKQEIEGSLTKLPGKTILGYSCLGYQYEDDEMITRYYVTTEPGVSFSNVFSFQKNKNLSSEWMDLTSGIMLEMEYESKKKAKDNMKMVCKELKKENFSIKKADYQ